MNTLVLLIKARVPGQIKSIVATCIGNKEAAHFQEWSFKQITL